MTKQIKSKLPSEGSTNFQREFIPGLSSNIQGSLWRWHLNICQALHPFLQQQNQGMLVTNSHQL